MKVDKIIGKGISGINVELGLAEMIVVANLNALVSEWCKIVENGDVRVRRVNIEHKANSNELNLQLIKDLKKVTVLLDKLSDGTPDIGKIGQELFNIDPSVTESSENVKSKHEDIF